MQFVSCPHCGTAVKSTALRCPACHADLAVTMRIPRQVGIWCEACGALVPKDAKACPSCGMPIRARQDAANPRDDDSADPLETIPGDEGDDSANDGQMVPRIDSALPAEPTDPMAGGGLDELPHARQILLFISIAALLLVAVVALIAHPWDPDAYSTKATVAADTSKVGFPGEIEALTSQDHAVLAQDAEVGEVSVSADVATYAALHDAWEALGALEDALATNERLLWELADGDIGRDALSDGIEQAQENSYVISGAIDSAQSADVSTETYELAREHVVTLGNWLRNWSDALTGSWDLVEQSWPGVSDRALAPLERIEGGDGGNAYRALFDEQYQDWEPHAPDAG